MQKRKGIALAAILGLGLTAPVIADDMGSDDTGSNESSWNTNSSTNANVNVSTADTNGDGIISRDEAGSDTRLVAQFSTLDTDRDGELSRTEVSSYYANNNPGRDDVRLGDGKIGDPSNDNPNIEGTIDDSTPGNPDELGPGR